MTNKVNVFSNVDAGMLASLEALCLRAGGRHLAHPQPDGSFTVTCTLPEPTHDVAGMIRIEVTPTDLDALQRVANSEVGHFGKYGQDQLRGGLGAVVDTVFNRVAHPKFPKTIAGVVNQRAQFSAINALGTWARLPQAPAAVAKIVAEHVRERAAGKPSEIDGATHFLNPHISSASAMAEWGRFLVNNVIRIYGNDAKRDVHYHGFPPGGTLPLPYIVSFAGQAALFDERGRLPVAGGSNEALRRRIVEVAEGEPSRS